jgi:hypothetical protein
MKRLAAIVLAVGMVVGAVFLRQRIDGDSGGGGSTGPFALRCATELAQVCTALATDRDDIEVTTEDPGTTADTLSALGPDEDPGFDAWLVDGPWPGIVADNRSFAGLDDPVLDTSSAVLARSPALIVSQRARRAELEATCGGTINWKCIGEQAATTERVGLPSPERGDGLAVLAEATASWFGTTDYSSGDFEDPGFTGWFDRLTELSTRTPLGRQTPLARALAASGTFSVVGALEAQSAQLLRGHDDYVTTYPEPMVTADVVLAPAAGVDVGDALVRLDADLLATRLAAEGWRVEGRDTIAGVDTAQRLPETSNMPEPGVLQTLRGLW